MLMAHFRKALSLPLAAVFALAAAALCADAESSRNALQEGIELFRAGRYEQAVSVMKDVPGDPSAGELAGEARFWTAKSCMALGRLEEAEKDLEIYLAQYPDAPNRSEAVYQKGRLLFMQNEYENSIRALEGFLAKYPGSPLAANAYFWIGESLYAMGRLDEATTVYRKIVMDYPASAKVEAAQYRISLVDLSRREVELAKLLKWSHEDFLKSVEEWEQREKIYAQAIASYQGKSSGAQTADSRAAAPSAELEEIQRQRAELERTRKLLAMKQEALDLKEAYLKSLESGKDGK
jgi:TolA-binding protein